MKRYSNMLRLALLAFTLVFMVAPDMAWAKGNEPMRTYQEQLAKLGYYTGKVDGLSGPMTTRAIKDFQKDYALEVDGKIGPQTKRQLADVAGDSRLVVDQPAPEPKGKGRKPHEGPQDKPRPAPGREGDQHVLQLPPGMEHMKPGPQKAGMPSMAPSTFGGAPIDTNEAVAPESNNKPQTAQNSRYGKFKIVRIPREQGAADYKIIFNGQTVLNALNQPSTIRTTPLYDVAGEDVVLVTQYTQAPYCHYQTYLIAVTPKGDLRGPKLIENCEGKHVEQVMKDHLYIGFANGYDGSTVGKYWRYSRGDLRSLL